MEPEIPDPKKEVVMEDKAVFAEISENGRWIEIFFKWDQGLVNAMHASQADFVPKEKAPDGVPFWRVPLDLEEARRLADAIGRDRIQLGDALTEWSARQTEQERLIHELISTRGDQKVKLTRLPKVLPELNKALRGYQREDVQYLAFVDNPLNANQQRLGKTLEAIAVPFEAGIDDGPNLVIAPKSALETVWENELHKWQPHPVFVADGPRRYREEAMEMAQLCIDTGIPFWLIINPAMARYKSEVHTGEDGVTKTKHVTQWPFLHETVWNNVIVDEAHRGALRNPTSVTALGIKGINIMETGKKQALTGTPMGGKPVNLFGIFQFLEPGKHPSKHRWAARWLAIEDEEYQVYGDVRSDRLKAFDRYTATIMLRRTRKEVLPELPDKDREDVWVDMTPKQREQYVQFAKMAAIKIEEEHLTATSILAEFMRLKQFSDSYKDLVDGKLVSTRESGKLEALKEKLDSAGIIELEENGSARYIEPEKGEDVEQHVIFSQFEDFASMIYDYLAEIGVPVIKITGKVNKKGERAALQKSFQAGDEEARVCVMTTQTGGLGITLNRGSVCHIMDETWNPDDQEQAEDRLVSTSEYHKVTAFYYRSNKSIESDKILPMLIKKGQLNKLVLDQRSKIDLGI